MNKTKLRYRTSGWLEVLLFYIKSAINFNRAYSKIKQRLFPTLLKHLTRPKNWFIESSKKRYSPELGRWMMYLLLFTRSCFCSTMMRWNQLIQCGGETVYETWTSFQVVNSTLMLTKEFGSCLFICLIVSLLIWGVWPSICAYDRFTAFLFGQ